MTTGFSQQTDRVFRFGPFELSERAGELRKNGVRIKLQEQPFRILLELVANAGRIVTREELQQKLWQADTFVDFDVGLNTAIRKLRQALNDDTDDPHYIETLAKRGYRFIAQVAGVVAATPPTSLDSRAQVPVSLSAEGTGSATHEESHYEPRRWYWVLAAACALALVIYGAVVYVPGLRKPQLATEQRVTANPPEAPITGAVVSPDGRYVVYSDTTGVYIRHIDSGETRQLQLPKDFDAVPASWFPDNAHLLMSVVEGGQRAPSLWKVSILGGNPQKVMEDASDGAVSPDRSKIAVLRDAVDARVHFLTFTGYARAIWLVDSNGSRRLSVADVRQDSGNAADRTTDARYSEVYFYRLAWSPDGSQIAYFRVYESGSNPDRFALETIGINGGPAKVVESSVHFGLALYWAADGRLLYAYRDDPRSEGINYGIWSVRVDEKTGEPEGKPKQVTKGVGRIGGLGVTADSRRLILWRVNTSSQVFLTEIDAATRRLKVARRLTLDHHRNIASAWTPDSSAVLFTSDRNGTFQLFRQAIDRTTPEMLVDGRNLSLPRARRLASIAPAKTFHFKHPVCSEPFEALSLRHCCRRLGPVFLI